MVCSRILRNRPPKIRLCTLPGATKMPTEAEAPPKDSATVYAAPARSEYAGRMNLLGSLDMDLKETGTETEPFAMEMLHE